jgi:predicted transcriptional regulator
MVLTEQDAIDAIRLYPHLTSKMKLSGQALDVYLHVRILKDGATVSKVSDVWGVSLQHANVILKSLVKKDYLTRFESPQKSGGYEFVYKAI